MVKLVHKYYYYYTTLFNIQEIYKTFCSSTLWSAEEKCNYMHALLFYSMNLNFCREKKPITQAKENANRKEQRERDGTISPKNKTQQQKSAHPIN